MLRWAVYDDTAGGTYELFAGRDASRSLATMTMTVSDQYDALEDLSQNERDKLSQWEKQFAGTLQYFYPLWLPM